MMNSWKAEIEKALPELLPADAPSELTGAMHYSLMAGGKRFRPLLVLAAGFCCGGDPESMIEAACAVEYVHTYSLIHDDLPAMDNDSLRRGKPTCHIRYGEATAILAGDALLTEAFHILARHPGQVTPATRLEAIQTLAAASGASGMAGGQVLDMSGNDGSVSEISLEAIHRGKTARLIQASGLLGALYATQDLSTKEKISDFGLLLGMLFQVTDDILDETSTAERMGKSPGKDRDQDKVTAPLVFGLEESIKRAREMGQKAGEILDRLGDRTPHLRELLEMVLNHLPK